ncbi:folylpolyglutamate synthase/dihydrofolate synthase family protein [soil metagenome]
MGDRIEPAHLEYQRAITALFARTGTSAKLGLERTKSLLAQLGNPERRFPVFHVAGTNGKGSVVAMLYALLRSKGFSVGRYTSPHLIDFRERIVVDDDQIGAQEVLGFLRKWEAESERLGATFFEITTVLAFDHFARRGVDVAVIETGMGGRLDATNVITPLVSGLTSVAIDHTEYLGNSLVAIAREKAGIFKPGVPALIGRLDPEAEQEIRRRAEEIGAPLLGAASLYPVGGVRVTADGTDVEFGTAGFSERVRVGLVGRPQGANMAIALAMLHAAGDPYKVSFGEAREVLPAVRLPGRFQRIGKFVVDVAHNLEAMRALRDTLEAVDLPRPLVAVVGIMRDKEWLEMLHALAPAVDKLVVSCPASAPTDRLWDLDELQQRWRGESGPISVIPRLPTALAASATSEGTVLVCGSFYTVGEALAELAATVPA